MAGLPSAFVARVLADLGPREGEELLAHLRRPAQVGLRVNSRVGRAVDVIESLGWAGRPLPWSPEGVILDRRSEPDRVGAGQDHTVAETVHPASSHPWHDAGAYYLQDPAAMGVVPVLDPQPGERVLDLAAAPGGKSTYIADRLAGAGLLWSHDVDQGRVGALVGNLERWGADNIVVSHGPVARLAPLYGTFDRVLVDAPCSGEGMFRKSPAAVALWSRRRGAEFVSMQARLLDEAVEFLRPGGVLVYSTCTFGADENEGAIAALLSRRDDVEPEIVSIDGASGGLAPHVAAFQLEGRVARWWPHRHAGEGHFVARLRKLEETVGSVHRRRARASDLPGTAPSRPELDAFDDFCQETLGGTSPLTGTLRRFGDWLHAVPDAPLPEALGQGGLLPRRIGTPLGRQTGGRFEPHHALSHLSTWHGTSAAQLDLDAFDPRVAAYLRGEVIAADVPDGWLSVRAAGLPLGWAKAKRGELNNHYPKGLRRG